MLEIGFEVINSIMGMSFQDLKDASYALWVQKYQEYINQIEFDLGNIPLFITNIDQSGTLTKNFLEHLRNLLEVLQQQNQAKEKYSIKEIQDNQNHSENQNTEKQNQQLTHILNLLHSQTNNQ
jgi:chromosomal replication initiation ATPase DnaA